MISEIRSIAQDAKTNIIVASNINSFKHKIKDNFVQIYREENNGYVLYYNERRRANLKFRLADFDYLIQKASSRNYNSRVFRAQMKLLPNSETEP